eukprot:Rhum_TRINITY_DN8288_c0_g1::Rhum_TRINITY_DN8288_c0_g1_i2::g.27091::m.27091
MLLEALTVGAVTDGVGKVLSVIGSVRKLEQKFDPAMSDFVLLWHRLSALDAPLRLLQRLQTREATRGDVEAAVQTATLVTEEVCAFLESDQPEDDERPNDFESWRRWLVQAKGHISRKEALPALSTRLDRAVQTVQVTLLTVQLTHAKIAADPCYPFLWLQGVAERAINIYSKVCSLSLRHNNTRHHTLQRHGRFSTAATRGETKCLRQATCGGSLAAAGAVSGGVPSCLTRTATQRRRSRRVCATWTTTTTISTRSLPSTNRHV